MSDVDLMWVSNLRKDSTEYYNEIQKSSYGVFKINLHKPTNVTRLAIDEKSSIQIAVPWDDYEILDNHIMEFEAEDPVAELKCLFEFFKGDNKLDPSSSSELKMGQIFKWVFPTSYMPNSTFYDSFDFGFINDTEVNDENYRFMISRKDFNVLIGTVTIEEDVPLEDAKRLRKNFWNSRTDKFHSSFESHVIYTVLSNHDYYEQNIATCLICKPNNDGWLDQASRSSGIYPMRRFSSKFESLKLEEELKDAYKQEEPKLREAYSKMKAAYLKSNDNRLLAEAPIERIVTLAEVQPKPLGRLAPTIEEAESDQDSNEDLGSQSSDNDEDKHNMDVDTIMVENRDS
eukprot:IDg6420t1